LGYRGISLIRNRAPLGFYSRTMPMALWWPYGGLQFLMSEVTLYRRTLSTPLLAIAPIDSRLTPPASAFRVYRGTSLIKKRTPIGPFRRPMHRVTRGS